MKKLVLLLVAVALVAGCSTPAPIAVYDKENAGPWANVNVEVTFTNELVKVSVKNFPATPNNYIRRFSLWDDKGKNVGERVFAATDVPEETFILEPGTISVSVSITSTGQGMWRTKDIVVPPFQAPPPRKPRPPIERQ